MPRVVAIQFEHLEPAGRIRQIVQNGSMGSIEEIGLALKVGLALKGGATANEIANDLLTSTVAGLTSASRAAAHAARQVARAFATTIRKPADRDMEVSGFGEPPPADSDDAISDIFRGERVPTNAHTIRVSPSSHSSSKLATAATSTPANRDQRSDEQLVVAHRAGDAGALRTLIDRYKGELHGFLTRLVGNRTGADDVFQEAFLQVHLSADNFDEERRFKPWLYTIAANKGRDYLRRQKRRSAVSLDAPVGAQSESTLVDLLGGTDAAPASSLEASDEATIVKFVVDELPGHFREILLLAYFQRMSYAQISDSLAIPLGTVKSRLHAAVACFAESWRIACARRGIRSDAKPLPLRARKEDEE